MIRKKMLDVKVFATGGREEKIRLFNIQGTDDYYVSGTAFDSKKCRYCGGLHFSAPDRWTEDEGGNYHPLTDLPDYVRKIYRMDDGQITDMVYDNAYNTMFNRYDIIDLINDYKNEIDREQRRLEKITDDELRSIVEYRLIYLAGKLSLCELKAREMGIYPEK